MGDYVLGATKRRRYLLRLPRFLPFYVRILRSRAAPADTGETRWISPVRDKPTLAS